MKAKHEDIRSERLFYCFVNFGNSVTDRPVVHVVPSACVAEAVRTSHIRWLATPGRKGQPHKDGLMRRFLPDYERVFGPEANPYPNGWLDQYRDAWHLLGLDAVPAEPQAECTLSSWATRFPPPR